MVLYLFGNNKPAVPPNFLFSDWHKQKFFYLIPQIFLFFFSKKLLYQKEPDRGKIRDRVPFLFLKFFKFLSGPDFRLSAPGIALPTGADAPRSVPPLFGSLAAGGLYLPPGHDKIILYDYKRSLPVRQLKEQSFWQQQLG